jgi:hypothetical protein
MAVPELGRRWSRRLGFLAVPSIVLLVGVQAGPSGWAFERTAKIDDTWRPGVAVGIKVRDGQATVRVPSLGVISEALVIVSSLSRAAGPFPVTIEAHDVAEPGIPDRAQEETPHPRPLAAFPPEAVRDATRSLPPSNRDFHMMVRDGDVTTSGNYLAVHGFLHAVGKHVQVYVAAEDQNEVGSELLNDLVKTFDEHILPVAARSFGLAHDIDHDGRFTVLLSSWLTRLGNGRHAVDGFVRVTDLDPLYSAPFGNRCDMMYLNTELRPGPHLRTIMAHEYMHAVVFSRKSHPGSGPACAPVEEEGWLDEALAHLAEDVHGFSRSNIDYRVKAFLCQPEHYQLVVEDYYAADLFRSRGHRGATYLFLRWCVSQYGPNLIPALVGSKLRGIANLEDATGCSFADLYRRWSVALCQTEHEHESAGPATAGQTHGDRPSGTKTHVDEWQPAGPRRVLLTSGGPVDHFRVAGTSSHFAVVRSSSAGNVEITVKGPSEALLQVTVIPGDADGAKLELSAKAHTAADGDLRLRARVRQIAGKPVRLTSLMWEPLVLAPGETHTPNLRSGALDAPGIASSFGSDALSAGDVLLSRSIRLDGVHGSDGPVVLRLTAVDEDGGRVSAWTEIQSRSPQIETALPGPWDDQTVRH